MPVEVLVSDLGNVILPLVFARRADALQRLCAFDADNAVEEPTLILQSVHDRLEFGIGGCSREEFFRQASATLNLDLSYADFSREYSDIFQEDPATVEILRRARVRHKFLLSNTDAIHWDWILGNYAPHLDFFERLLTSHELQALKPDATIYRKVEALTGLPPAAHLLIDDLTANVEGARACGWDGIVHTDAATLEAQLRERNLLP
ncbi:MAG TPA: HAD-IA family hydrolase [Chthonomonadaceae bacterium]|nr:HAD-IA family hydrolase [Chthonomonadaceae bacterium]